MLWLHYTDHTYKYTATVREEYADVLMKNCILLNPAQKLCTPIFYLGVVITAVYFSTLTVPLLIKPNSLQKVNIKNMGK